VVTSVFGSASSTVEEMMRNVQLGNLADAPESPFEFVSMNSNAPQSVVDEMNQILMQLTDGEIKTNVLPQSP
jgi:hypothetical protein